MKLNYSKLLWIIMIIVFNTTQYIYAQPDPGNNGGGGPLGGGAPIGGGLGILLALGIGYGLKKLWDKKKKHLNE